MIGICCHDAGGADLLARYIKTHPDDYLFCLDGPATDIFKHHVDHNLKLVNTDLLLEQASSFICGSSWQSDIELKLIQQAKRLTKPTTVMLDHWVNFNERFIRENEATYPDQIWVTNNQALKIAKETLPKFIPLTLVENQLLKDTQKTFASYPRRSVPQPLRVLYVTEPTSTHASKQHNDPNYFGYTEFDALTTSARFLNESPVIESIVLRTHPAEANNKYNHIFTLFNKQPSLSINRSLEDDIKNADVVIGATTMAMVTALYAGRWVFSSLPEHLQNPLPFDEIQPISLLNKILAPNL